MVTYYVALPFVDSDEGPLPAEAQECQSVSMAVRRAETLSRKAEYVGALAFQRSGELNDGTFSDAVVLKTFGLVPEKLDEL